MYGGCAGAGVTACGMTLAGGFFAAKHKKNKRRAVALQEPVRVVKRCSPNELACVLSACASPNDTVETVRCACSQSFLFCTCVYVSASSECGCGCRASR